VADKLDWEAANRRDLVRRHGSVSRYSGLEADGTELVTVSPKASEWVETQLPPARHHPLVSDYVRLSKEERAERYEEYAASLGEARATDVARLVQTGPLGTATAVDAYYSEVYKDLDRCYQLARQRLAASVKLKRHGLRAVKFPRSMKGRTERLTRLALLRKISALTEVDYQRLKAHETQEDPAPDTGPTR
jgi:hypothetical protein